MGQQHPTTSSGDLLLPERPTGTVPTDHGPIAFWRIGPPSDAPPLLCLHGGPGMPSAYLAPLAALANDRQVIFYDQSGCGLSTRQRPDNGWTIRHFVAELHSVVGWLGLERYHLFGNSWGGWLAMEFVLGRPAAPPGSLTLSSAPPSVAGWIAEVSRLRSALPAATLAVLEHHERAGSTDTREYRRALAEFNHRHLCRISPWPQALRSAIAGFGDEVYAALWGDSEFGPVTGALRGWDVTDRLPQVTMPTLVTGGRHDEAAPEQLAAMAERLPQARLRIFPESSHLAFLEEPVDYVTEVDEFLAAVDRDAGAQTLPLTH